MRLRSRPAEPTPRDRTESRPTRVSAGAEDAGARLDRFLARRLPVALAIAHSAADQGPATCACRADTRRAGARSLGGSRRRRRRARPPARRRSKPRPLPLAVLYDDADLVVVDKPAGMVVHPAAGHARGTLVNALLHHVSGLSGIGGRERPGIVHRLDRGTSGRDGRRQARSRAPGAGAAVPRSAKSARNTSRSCGARRASGQVDRSSRSAAIRGTGSACRAARAGRAPRRRRIAARGIARRRVAGARLAGHRPHASDSRAPQRSRPSDRR